jgi:hypothetical protein
MFTAIRNHWIASLAGGAATVGIVLFVLVYFAPQALFINNRVNEAIPVPSASASARASTSAAPATPAGPVTLSSGSFRSLEHATSGRAVLLLLSDGSVLLRLEDFSTSNGPDVHVYLSAASADGPMDAFGTQPVELGPLKANQGNINYSVPARTDLSTIKSAVIWCRRFSVGFGVAPLNP